MFKLNFTYDDIRPYGYKKFNQCLIDAYKKGAINFEDIGCLIRFLFYVEDPDNENNIRKDNLMKCADTKAQYDRLLHSGFIKEYDRPSSKGKNKYDWTFIISSIPCKQYLLFFNAAGEITDLKECSNALDYSNLNTRSYSVCNLAVCKLSNLALSLYAFMLSLKKKSVLDAKKKIKEESGVYEDKFDLAWNELKDAGFLTVIKKATQNGFKYDFLLNCKPTFPSEITITKNDVDNPKTSSFFVSSQNSQMVGGAKSKNIVIKEQSILAFIENRYFSKSSLGNSFDDELKSVLNKIKKRYCDLGNTQHESFIDTLNRLIIKKYKGKYVDLERLVITYKKVLSLFEKSAYVKIICMNAYCRKVLNNAFYELFALDSEVNQNYDKIERLLNEPLEHISKSYKTDCSDSDDTVSESKKTDKKEFDLDEFDLEHGGESDEEYVTKIEKESGINLPIHAKKNKGNAWLYLSIYFKLEKNTKVFSTSDVMREFCRNEVIRIRKEKEKAKRDMGLKITYNSIFGNYCLDYKEYFKDCPIPEDNYNLWLIISGKESYKSNMNFVEKLKKWNPDIESLFEKFDILRVSDERFKARAFAPA